MSDRGYPETMSVAVAAAASYAAVGFPTEGSTEMRHTFIVPSLRRLEHVASRVEEIDQALLQRTAAEECEIWVLLPLSEIGLGHERLRGFADRIQPWWWTDGGLRFGSPRLP